MNDQGLLCRCSVCEREERAGDSPLTRGWPKCCGYTMTLVDTERFIASLDDQMGRAFAGVTAAKGALARISAQSAEPAASACSVSPTDTTERDEG
jgi:hypothetical protein